MSKSTKYPKEAGLYKLTCSSNGKIYIGKASNINNRINFHRNCGKNSKLNSFLKNAIVKYGWESFEVDILEVVENFDKLKDNETLLIRESYYIKLLDSTNREKGYNICSYSNDNTGRSISDEHKAKISKGNLGKIVSEETREKMRNSQLGKSLSQDHKKKISRANLGKICSDDVKDKMRQRMLGKKMGPCSDETKSKISKSKLGKIKSEETKEKMRQNRIGKLLSEETKEKIRQSKLGKKMGPHSEEVKEKIRQSQLKRFTELRGD